MNRTMLRGSILALVVALTACSSSEPSAAPADDTGGSTGSGGDLTGGNKPDAGKTDASAGSTGTGGKTGTGGATGAGGASGSGGATGSGGKTGSGGATGSGGGPISDAAIDVHFTGAKAKIMPLGDSITASTCWRARLAEKLDAGAFQYSFVGSQNGDPGCANNTYDKHNEGHGGFLVADQSDGTLNGWFTATPPDIVLMHFGTNDCWGEQRTKTQILDAFTRIVTDVRAVSPKVILLVAKIIPLDPNNDGSCGVCPQSAIDLNNLIPAWAAGLSTASSPIVVVDQWTGFNDAADTRDGVHPNDSGSVKMANKWYAALSQIL